MVGRRLAMVVISTMHALRVWTMRDDPGDPRFGLFWIWEGKARRLQECEPRGDLKNPIKTTVEP
jgi:hypothetical protein